MRIAGIFAPVLRLGYNVAQGAFELVKEVVAQVGLPLRRATKTQVRARAVAVESFVVRLTGAELARCAHFTRCRLPL